VCSAQRTCTGYSTFSVRGGGGEGGGALVNRVLTLSSGI
jgi:hypothetical protein